MDVINEKLRKMATNFGFEMPSHTLSTLNPSVDSLLQNGIKSKCITYITGPRSSGKTQLCLQLAFSMQLEEGNEPKRTLFWQPHKLYPINRLEEISSGVLNKIKETLESVPDDDVFKMRVNAFDVKKSMENTLFHYGNSGENILHLKSALPQLVAQKNIKLIVIDNIEDQILSGSHTKENDLNTSFAQFLRILQIIAFKKDLAVVITARQRSSHHTSGAYNIIKNTLEELSKYQVNLEHIFDLEFKAIIMKSPLINSMNSNERAKSIKITGKGVFELSEVTQNT